MNEISNTKKCRKCNETKPCTDFSPDRRICRKCVTQINLQQIRSCPEKYKQTKEQQQQWECNNKENRNIYNLEWRKNNAEKLLLYHARARAKKYNIYFDLKLEDIIIPEKCPILGIAFERTLGKSYKYSPNSPSIDRIVPSKGYIKNNICIISVKANMIKNCGSIKDHENVIEYMRKNGCE